MLTIPTAFGAESRNVSSGRWAGRLAPLRTLVVRAHFLEAGRRLVMQVAVRFSMRCSERRNPPP